MPRGCFLLHRLLQLEDAGEATFDADEGRGSFCLGKSVKCSAVYLFMRSVLIAPSAFFVQWISALVELLGETTFLLNDPGSTCVYWSPSLPKYWSSFVLAIIESEDRLVAWKGVASLCLLICQTSIQYSELTQMWCKRSGQTNGEKGPEFLSGAGVCLIDMIGIGNAWPNYGV